MLKTWTLVGAAVIVGMTAAVHGQAQYRPYPYAYAPYAQTPPYPPQSSYYDPYTSGLGPCPQRGPGDPPCSELIQPSLGQPNYWRR